MFNARRLGLVADMIASWRSTQFAQQLAAVAAFTGYVLCTLTGVRGSAPVMRTDGYNGMPGAEQTTSAAILNEQQQQQQFQQLQQQRARSSYMMQSMHG